MVACVIIRLLPLVVFVLVAAEDAVESAAEDTAEAVVSAKMADELSEKEIYTPPDIVEGAQFYESFVNDFVSRWVVSKDAEFTGKWKHETFMPDALEGDKGLEVGDAAQRHAVSTTFGALDPKGTGLVIQYELQLKNGLQCGGAYLKLLTASEELFLEGFKASTPYTIMFGPDKCGETNKVHFILRHKSPVTGEWEEKHLVTPPTPNTSDKESHLYTAVVRPDNTVTILVDNEEKKSVSLLSASDFSPPINPPKEIDDPADTKPSDWVDESKMDDPVATKPADWDEDAPKQIEDPKAAKLDGWLDDAPLKVPDPSVEQPSDWDEDEDGEWEAPLIDNPDCKAAGCGRWNPPKIANPDYKGKWFAPKVDNPHYVGVWKPKQIANPNYFEDNEPHAMAPIGGIGIELWTMQNGILFDNILVSTDPSVAESLAAGTFVKRKEAEKASKRAAAREVPKGEGFFGKIRENGTKLGYFVLDNILKIMLTLCLGLVPVLLYCCWPSKTDHYASVGDDDDDDDDDGVVGMEEEEEEEREEEAIQDVTTQGTDAMEEKLPSAKAAARNRGKTPKAAD